MLITLSPNQLSHRHASAGTSMNYLKSASFSDELFKKRMFSAHHLFEKRMFLPLATFPLFLRL